MIAALVAAVVLGFAAAAVLGQHAQSADRWVADKAWPSRVATAALHSFQPSGSSDPADDGFWQLVEQSRRAAGADTGQESGLLEERLSKLPPAQIVAFQHFWDVQDRRLYTSDVWGAAYVIEDGCSDDCFRDFRHYLIFLGHDAVDHAVSNPDLLAPIVQDAETGDWENADDVAPDAYSSATGNDFPYDTSDLSGRPRGRAWDDNNLPALLARFPHLSARFR